MKTNNEENKKDYSGYKRLLDAINKFDNIQHWIEGKERDMTCWNRYCYRDNDKIKNITT
jgi:hypothetical protein